MRAPTASGALERERSAKWAVVLVATALLAALLLTSPLAPRGRAPGLARATGGASGGGGGELRAGFSGLRRAAPAGRARAPAEDEGYEEGDAEEEAGGDAEGDGEPRGADEAEPVEDAGLTEADEEAAAAAEDEGRDDAAGGGDGDGGDGDGGEGGVEADAYDRAAGGEDGADEGPPAAAAPPAGAPQQQPPRAGGGTAPAAAAAPPAAPAGSGAGAPGAAAAVDPALRRFVYVPPPAAPGGCRPFSGMVVVMTLTHLQARPPAERGFCASLWRAQAAGGFAPIIIGDTTHLASVAAEEEGGGAAAAPPPPYVHLLKVSSHLEFLGDVLAQRSLPNDTLVVYHDALDVLALGDAAALFDCISGQFCARRMDPAQGVYFLGERSLWPPSCRYVDDARSWCNDHPELLPLPVYPNFTEPGGSAEYRFINSGMYAGSPPALHALLAASMAQSNATGSGDDQELFNDLATNWPDTWRRRFQLDTRQQCFGSAHRADGQLVQHGASGKWVNGLTGGAPLLLHFNGGGKELFGVIRPPSDGRRWSEFPDASVLLWGHGPASSRAARTADVCEGAPDER
jgi:hypothetical protein